jgi:uncharacterized protein YkwD
LLVRAPDLARPITETYPAPSRPDDPVKLAVWERINADRSRAGLAPVAWDPAASRVADRFCAEQVQERTRGHFLTDGLPPYARTAFAGIFGMQAENVVAWISSGPKFQDTSVQLALAGQASMMGEVPPADGHRRTILDPDATHVGVGYASERGNFRMAQEFLTRRLAELTLQLVADDPNTIRFKGRPLSPYRFAFATLSREPSPRHLTKAEANARANYTYPQAALAYVAEGNTLLHVVGTVTEDRVRIEPNGDFSFRFTPGQPGLWTIVFYTSSGRDKPSPGGLAAIWIERPAAP